MNNNEIKYIARSILHNGKVIQYFPSPAFIKEKIVERDDNCGNITKYVIEFCEQYGHPRIEDYPFETGYYYGELFNSKSACQTYVDTLNIRFPFSHKRALSILDHLPQSSFDIEPDYE